MPAKPLLRRDQMEGVGAGSDSFDHIARSGREHSIPLTEPQPCMMWGSEPYPHTEHQPAITASKILEEAEDLR